MRKTCQVFYDQAAGAPVTSAVFSLSGSHTRIISGLGPRRRCAVSLLFLYLFQHTLTLLLPERAGACNRLPILGHRIATCKDMEGCYTMKK